MHRTLYVCQPQVQHNFCEISDIPITPLLEVIDYQVEIFLEHVLESEWFLYSAHMITIVVT